VLVQIDSITLSLIHTPFSRTNRVSQCLKKSSSGIYGAREYNRGKHTDHPARRHSIRTNQQPNSIIPHFYSKCPSCRNPPTLSWLGTGTKYAGLHIQWHGFVVNTVTVQTKKDWLEKINWLLTNSYGSAPVRSSPVMVTMTHNNVFQPLHRSTCISRQPQLRTGGFQWSEVLLSVCPCWQQLAHSD